MKKVTIKDFKLKVIDINDPMYEVTWGDDPVSNCTHVFIEMNPMNKLYYFSFCDEDYPEIRFGCTRSDTLIEIENDMIKSLVSYLVGINKISI